MTVVTNVGAMPALGVQFVSMANYSRACMRIEHSDKMVSEAWSDANKDVFQPFGVKWDHLGPPSGEENIRNHIRTVTPLVREKFDGKIAKLFTSPLTKEILDKQKIDVDKIVLAREMELISETPANTLLQSAILLTRFEKAKRLEPAHIIKVGLALVTLGGLISGIASASDGAVGAAFGFGLWCSAVLLDIMWRSITFDRVDRSAAETLQKSLTDNVS